MYTRFAALLLSLSSVLVALPLPGRAELPPWVYGAEQRQAPLQLELRVLRVQTLPGPPQAQLELQARVLAVRRQGQGAALRPGDSIRVRYPLPPLRPSGWVGPAPLPLLRAGEQRPAWLAPDPALPGIYRPAAGGRSFGPSLEDVAEPPAQSLR